MEIIGERVILNKFHSKIKLLCVQVESEIWVKGRKQRPHFQLLHIFNVATLIYADYIETTGNGQLTVQVLEHLVRTGAKPYCIDSVPIHGGLGVSVVGLVYIALSCAELAIATSATHPLIETRDIKQFIAFKGRPTGNTVAQLDIFTDVEMISVFVRVEFFAHNNSVVIT